MISAEKLTDLVDRYISDTAELEQSIKKAEAMGLELIASAYRDQLIINQAVIIALNKVLNG